MRRILEILDNVLNATVVFGYDKIGYWTRRPLWDASDTNASMRGKICVITGANSGLGKATATRLAELGATVYMVCRNPRLGQEARDEIVRTTGNESVFLDIVDMSSQRQIREYVRAFHEKSDRLDVLINNAGVLLNERQESEDGIEMTFAVNVLGYFLLTNLFIPFLQQSPYARVINVSSGGMYAAKLHLEDPQFAQRPYNGVQAYAETKRAEVIMTEIWAEKPAEAPVFFAAMHPGWADTKAVKNSLPLFWTLTRPLLRTPEQGADTVVWLAVNPHLEHADSGKFWFDRKTRPTHRFKNTHNTPEEIRQLWDACCEMTGYKENA